MPIAANLANPIPQDALPGQLLDVASEITLEKGGESNRSWLSGISWQPEVCQGLFSSDVDICTRIDFVEAPRLCVPNQSSTAFGVYDAFKGATLEFEPEEIGAILEGRITARLSAAFATELLAGTASGDRALRKDAHAPVQRPLASAAAPIWYVLTVLEDDLARNLRGTKGMIHLPPGLLGQAKATYGVYESGGRWYTPYGNLVVADAGYIDAPQPTGGGSASPVGTDWVYASGPVRYLKTAPKPVDDGNIGSTMTNYTGTEDIRSADYRGFRTHNDMVRFMDVYGIFQFDPCPVTAALASYEQTDIV